MVDKPRYTDFELPITVAGVRFRNPFHVASGPTAMSIEQLRRIRDTGWGGASLKLTVDPLPYINRRPRYQYFNEGEYLAFTAEKRLTLDELLRLIEQGRRECPQIVLFSNITYAGEDIDGWVAMARKCQDAGVQVNELNFGCPNMSFNVEMSGTDRGGPRTGASMGRDAEAVSEVVRAIKAETDVPVFVRLSPEGGQLRFVAKAALEAGADAAGSNGNRLGVAELNLDAPGESPVLLQKELGLSCMSGRWVLPLGKRDAYEIRRMVGPEAVVTANGGVTEWRDAVEMAMCGADLIGLCTVTLTKGFGFMPKFIHDVKAYMAAKGYGGFGEMRDLAVTAMRSAPELTLFEGVADVDNAHLAAPCVRACPAHVPAQGYVRAVAEQRFETAWRLIVSKNPLQSICGKICNHPCEEACTRAATDEPLRIRDIKDFVLDHARKQGWKSPIEKAPARGRRVAVVGSGPAGLSAAHDLALAGYGVTVFEKSDRPGGVLARLIPSFRMGREELDEEIDGIRALGVEIRTGVALGTDFTVDSLKADGHAAVFLAIGAWAGSRIDIPGRDADGCVDALDFLTSAGPDGPSLAGRRVGVIGGGFTAVDAARAAVRMGAAEVYILYRRTHEEMPATAEELSDAEQEGVRVMYLVSPQEVLVDSAGAVEALRMVNHVLGESDDSGRRRPETIRGTEFVLKLDRVVLAVSQETRSDATDGVATTRGGFFEVDPYALRTNVPEVYAGGDCIGGQMDMISAIAHGKRAAAAIDAELAGADALLTPEPELTAVAIDDVLTRHRDDARRPRMPVHLRPALQRRVDWNLCRSTMTAQEAVTEARRCYGCGCGAGCETCMELCPQFAFDLDGWRIHLDHDKCVGCGMCIWRCPAHNLVIKQTSDEPI